MKKKLVSILLVGTMAISLLAGCGNNANENTENPDSAQGAGETTGQDTPLVAGYAQFSSKFSPFFSDTGYDTEAMEMTQESLLTTDRSGGIVYNAIEGETIPYNGTDYTYTGIANWDVEIDDAGDTTYTISIRDDVMFSDGELMDIDDVIFNMYVLCDTDYDGSVTLSSMPIKGIKEYRANSSAASSVTDETVAGVLAEMPEAVTESIAAMMNGLLEAEYAWVEADVMADPTGYGLEEGVTTEQAFAAFYATDESYDPTGKDAATIVADIAAMYNGDYVALATAYGDGAYFDEQVYDIAYSYAVEQLKAAGEGEEVPNIAGIERIDDYTLKVTTDGYDATCIYQLGVIVAPMHYYGDESLYDYENNSFGFTRGDLSIVREKTEQPLGAGPYVFEKYENKTIYYTANQNYFQGVPKIASVQFKETAEIDKITGVEQGTIDLTDPSGSKSAFEQIGAINGTGEIVGDKIVTNAVDNLGYGYIGANADTVNVGGEPDSEASRDLRKAFMTVLSVYRNVAIDSYYGDAASIINYPISNTSWAAPQQSDSDYQVAYSVDVEGNPIYTDGMSAEDSYAAALQAALGYFEAAGYTVTDGKVTAAPEGASLEYEIIIPAEGSTDHPSLGILTDASAALESIGIKLTINNPSDSNILWNSLDAGSQNFWVAAWQATIDPDMYQTYHSTNIVGKGGTNSNHYHIADTELDSLIMEARQSDDQSFRKAVYKQCLDTILDWGVELPVYQRQNCIIYSPERINADTVTPDITTFYKWYYEIDKMEMN